MIHCIKAALEECRLYFPLCKHLIIPIKEQPHLSHQLYKSQGMETTGLWLSRRSLPRGFMGSGERGEPVYGHEVPPEGLQDSLEVILLLESLV